ncbi:MAG: tRNA (adenosine(37)-N6)-dimethylallyltransferase MiaA [Cellulosilyticaceae bacterium]
MTKKPLILIAGPTASGKTKTSVMLARQMGGEIISADSMQLYKQMDIGTAKVRPEEMDGIPHYMIDELDATQSSNVAWFKNKVTEYIDAIHAKGKVPILVGGTGFYINAILFDTEFEETKEDHSYRDSLAALVLEKGPLHVHQLLEEIDPKSAKAIHPNNSKRVIRALEYYHQTGEPISSHNFIQKDKRLQMESPYDYTFFVLNMERDILYSRINQRVDQMIDEGVVSEVKSFFDKGLTEDMTSMKAIGYKEFFPYFRQESTLDDCIDKLKQNTRQYAKRQLTWFRHQTTPIFIDVDKLSFNAILIVDEMKKHIEIS